MPAGFLQQRENETMQNTIENNKNSLANLLVTVQDQASRNADYLAPLKDLQKTTTETGKPQIVVEQSGGVPTQFSTLTTCHLGKLPAMPILKPARRDGCRPDIPPNLTGF